MEIHSMGTVTTSARFDFHGGVNEDFSLLEYDMQVGIHRTS